MYVLHDINMQYEDLTVQIDYIVITSACIYFIECKNLIGNITVNNRGEFIREYEYKGKNIKEGIYSPIRQAQRHTEIFKKIWNSRNTKLINKIQMKHFDNWVKYIVVMSNPKNILNLKFAPKDIKNKIIRSDNLVRYLQNEINMTPKDMLSNEKNMKENADGFLNNYNINLNKDYEIEYRKMLNSNNSLKINSNLTDNILREKLTEFRKNTAKGKNIPAYYIFNNEELEKIIQYKPKNINDLKNLNILSDIKIKIHGKNIIDIIIKSIDKN